MIPIGWSPAVLMHSINNSNWTWRAPDTKVYSSVTLSGIAQAQNPQFGHPISTVVINNSATDVEWFGFHPIEWLRGWFVPTVFPSLGWRL
jgi:hypothetical protein